jgi:hypothetical protein
MPSYSGRFTAESSDVMLMVNTSSGKAASIIGARAAPEASDMMYL